jgi:hypothetical protein
LKPELVLVLTLVLGTVGLTALFWALAVSVQGYLYNQPADKLPLRALVAGLGVAIFLTGWTYLNTRASHPDKYGVLHEAKPTKLVPIEEFEEVRRYARFVGNKVEWIKDEKGQPKEETVAYKWQPGGAGGRFVEPGTAKEFRTNTSSYMTVALLIPEGGGKKTRFEAEMQDGTYTQRADDERRFTEQGGERYINANNPRQMEVPSAGGFAAVVAINVLHFVVWFLAFWLGLQFTVGHSLGLAAAFGAASMLILMPLLFDLNKVKPVVAAPPPTPAAPK